MQYRLPKTLADEGEATKVVSRLKDQPIESRRKVQEDLDKDSIHYLLSHLFAKLQSAQIPISHICVKPELNEVRIPQH